MKKTWFDRQFDRLGEVTESKHERGRTLPCGHRRALRDARKRQRQARKAQRGRG